MLYNPSVQFYNDGSIVILATDIWVNGVKREMPMYAGDGDVVWVDYPNNLYRNNIRECSIGAFKGVWKQGGIYHISVYKKVNLLKRVFMFLASPFRSKHEIS